jgi:hypothetical protein
MPTHSLDTVRRAAAGARTPARPTALRNAALFVALLATSIALGGALAHLFELPNKIDLPKDHYFVVQQIYRGWVLLAGVLVVELAALVALIATTRDEPVVRRLAIAALAALVVAQVVFWVFTQPANVATENWTYRPEGWETLRSQWEYSHAVGAVCQLVAMAALSWAAAIRSEPSAA